VWVCLTGWWGGGGGGTAPALLLLAHRRGRRGGECGGGEGGRATGRVRCRGWQRGGARQRQVSYNIAVEMRTCTRRQQDEEGGDHVASARRHRYVDLVWYAEAHGRLLILFCFQRYSTARSAGDSRSVAIHRPSSVTLPLGRPPPDLHLGIETHIHLPRNRCRSQPRTPHPTPRTASPPRDRGRIDPSSIDWD
jgi:hypothetical protein